ncbi:transmembrane protein 272 [Sparus aurata]|uniref:Transmembrane protein 272-like n=1 Tax=Sparus aurata TaxID=8175 RepID=A0A671W392_SPAAU|nr:transmembrane protein 272-like [Sparus aurata]XP_030285588.1 transmembrane protein 272-like [Sparus aurata]
MSNTRLVRQIRNAPQLPTPALVISKLVLCAMPIAEIVIGAIHLNDCPRKHFIPIYLIVLGAFGLMLAVLSCLPCAQEPKDSTTNPLSRLCATWNSLVSLFLFCWFICGNVWIYSIYKPNFDKNTTATDPYCDRTLYLFAFWVTTLVYILFGVFLVGGCLVLVCFYLCGRADADDNV